MMRKLLIVLIAIVCTFAVRAQTFSWNGNVSITDFTTDTIPLTVTNMPPTINSNFGVAKVCFSATHSYKSDITVSLLAPDGHKVLLVQGEGGDADAFTQTCVGMDGVPFELGTPPFTGLYLPMGDISTFNNGQNPNGTWKLLVADVAAPDSGTVLFASITFANNPPPGGGLGGNNLGPTGPFMRSGVVCPGGVAGCDLLPDVTASAYEIANNLIETPGMLRVSNGTPNIGYGPLEIFGIDSCFCDGIPAPCNVACAGGAELQHIVRQRIYQKRPGTDTLGFYDRNAGIMTFHPEHGHLHVDHWADFTLRSATTDPDARNWPIIGTSVKQSYCLVNLGTCAGRPGECADNDGNPILNVPNQNLGFYTGCGLNQGIYPGNWDVYSTSLNEPIMLDNVCNGTYYIVSITDPNNMFVESDETNNWVAVPVTLTQQNAIPVIASNSSSVLCQEDSIVLTASITPNYIWSTGESTRSIVVKTPGNYTVSSSCGSSLVTSAPFMVTQLPLGAKPSLRIAITNGDSSSCAGNPITFTATPTYGGTSPAYQWKINGVATGSTSNNFTTTTLTSGQSISCELRSDISCFTDTTVSSNSITVRINPIGNASASIVQTKGSNTLCSGDTATFHANVINGVNMHYQWKLNGSNVGADTSIFSSTTLANGYSVLCNITGNAACPIKAIIGNGTNSNSSTASLGAAYPTYYGNAKQQHLILASELTAAGISSGNLSSLGFTVGNTVGDPGILNGFTIKLATTSQPFLGLNFLVPAFTTVFGPVNYQPQLNTVNTHPFTTPFFWDGNSNILVNICFESQVLGRRSYQNTVSVTPFISTSYFQTDASTPGAACTKLTANSTGNVRPNMVLNFNPARTIQTDSIVLSVNSATLPSVAISITSGDSLHCIGTVTTFKATPNNTGANPAYQWTKNGIVIAGNSADTLSVSEFSHNDTIRCRMTAGLTCGTLQQVVSNAITIKIPLPIYTFTGNGNWNVASNWANNAIPPARLPACSEIVINPVAGECYLNQQQVIAPGARFTIMSGKKIRLAGNMLIRQ